MMFKNWNWKCELVDFFIASVIMIVGFFSTLYVSTLTDDIAYIFGSAYFWGMVFGVIPQCKKWFNERDAVEHHTKEE